MRARMWLWGAVGLVVLAAGALALEATRDTAVMPGQRRAGESIAASPEATQRVGPGPAAPDHRLRGESLEGSAGGIQEGRLSPVPPDQRVAARFLGVSPEAVQAVRAEPIVNGSRGERATVWRYPAGETPDSGEGATVAVDIDLYYVTFMGRADEKYWGSSARAGFRPLAREVALRNALAFAERRCWFWRAEDRLEYEKYYDYRKPPTYHFAWEGLGPEEFRHRLSIQVSAATGEVVYYYARIAPADPPPNAPVRLTEEEAVAKVLARATELWPRMRPPISAKVFRPWTASGFAPPGTPVYIVNVHGAGPPGPTGEPGEYLTECGVNANTGEILTRSWRREPEPLPKPRLSPSEALARARSSLPTALRDAEIVLGELTWVSPIAPSDRLVYPVRVSGKLPGADKPDELQLWAQSWAVDAETGRIYGLADRPAKAAAPARE